MPPSPDSERPPKRQKSSSPMANIPNVIDVAPMGTVLMTVSELAGVKSAKLRLSQDMLTIASPIFADMITKAMQAGSTSGDAVLIDAAEDDEPEALYLLFNILHNRNEKLPSRLTAEALCKLARMVEKYKCATSIGRGTTMWFDRLYNSAKAGTVAVDVWKMVEATFLLDEPMFFARFTEMWVLSEPLASNTLLSAVRDGDVTMKRLAVELFNRRHAQSAAIKGDVDLLVDPCSVAFAQSAKHYIDYAPGMPPDADDDGKTVGSMCHVDEGAAIIFLGALRDDLIWPPLVWPTTLGALISQLQAFRTPAYDDCDKCDFCEDVKTRFGLAVDVVKKMHKDRLWGLCLDCFKAGGVKEGECRYEHSKPKGK
ncbi:hypothetical protein LTR02_001922 [Friedmanniomyces endolithicus]|uniref:BTB domain-containing protein n=2 Tax=Dothideomycetidae TaxID=451867 RepID=A0A4U0V7L3_9PEZI|nr:hypothetical protein LTS09_015280 [Friedmanniomyces endolithicus]KAK5145183.1 hypothetical protein LTR32_003023 [Rachicladosporium monterosium]KAK0355695.1 hypothetical protein LTR94_007578 [Friedmanniomyces endolithicus]KAK0785338.1 hypothetical protein LTR59_011062 [Friedmanniomyces endolithicus]KAK0796998.1 hypothetical protein LTR75_010007 [Friedmanniomyces endolithicus]